MSGGGPTGDDDGGGPIKLEVGGTDDGIDEAGKELNKG